MQSDDEASSPFAEHPLLGTRLEQQQQQHYGGEEELSAVEADHDVGSNTESSRGCEEPGIEGWDPPSLVNGSSGGLRPASQSNYQFRQSPSLFSDPFKLEMTNSMHN